MRPICTIFVSVLALMSVATACTSEKKNEETTEELPQVKVQSVFEESVSQIVEYTASVEAYKVNSISASSSNRIKQILVDVGATVHKGQTLVILDNVNLDQMKLNLANYKRDLDRAEELLKIGGGTQQSVDQLRTQYEAYRRSTQNVSENTTLTSPVNGVVSEKNYNNGDMTGANAILVIQQIQPVKVIINVSELKFSQIHVGMGVKMTFDAYGDEEFDGKVSLIHPTIDSATRTFEVEINVANGNSRVRPGMFGRVKVNYGTEQHVVVPDMAIVKQTGSGNKYVYVYKDGKVKFQQVELGQRLGDRYELLSGVADKSRVVVYGQNALADGVAVKVLSGEVALGVPGQSIVDTTAVKKIDTGK